MRQLSVCSQNHDALCNDNVSDLETNDHELSYLSKSKSATFPKDNNQNLGIPDRKKASSVKESHYSKDSYKTQK
jgi:hypothetical protein